MFYDASAWSIANFYNVPYVGMSGTIQMGSEVVEVSDIVQETPKVAPSNYAYLVPWQDYNAPALLHKLLKADIKVLSAFKPFSIKVAGTAIDFGYGTLMIPVAKQKLSSDNLNKIIAESSEKYHVPVYGIESGYSIKGIDLGSRHFNPIAKPKVLLFVGEGVSSYESGEVWHLLDQRVGMPITKVDLRTFDRINWHGYETLIMVSGGYQQLDSLRRKKISDWVSAGNTLITTRQASAWAINQKLIKHELIKAPKKDKEEEEPVERSAYVGASEELGRESVGGAIFEVDLDLTHPLAFGYTRSKLPVYRNSTVWLAPSKNAYCTVAKYTEDPHIDGFITDKNLETFLKPSASLIVEPLGRGRVVLFAENPNFRGSWYGTNRLFLNAIFLGSHIRVPRAR